jgi:hypothetical protein
MNESRNDGPRLSDADLETLLEQSQRRDPRRERVLRNVLAAVGEARPATEGTPAAPPVRKWRRLWPGIAVAAGAASLSAAVIVKTQSSGEAWRARGGGERAISRSFDVVCTGGPLARCPAGSTLIFRAQGTTAGGYLSAYADPVTPGGQRIWYFTDLALPVMEPNGTPVMLRSGVRIGPEHAIGTYRLHLVVSRKPISREASSPEQTAAEQIDRLVVVPP